VRDHGRDLLINSLTALSAPGQCAPGRLQDRRLGWPLAVRRVRRRVAPAAGAGNGVRRVGEPAGAAPVDDAAYHPSLSPQPSGELAAGQRQGAAFAMIGLVRRPARLVGLFAPQAGDPASAVA
jgi:hypothetical protein